MKARGAMIQGALAAAGLVVAFATWQREPEKAAGEVDVVDLGKGELVAVRYQSGPRWVELQREGEGKQARLFVTIAEPPPAPPAPPPPDGGTPAPDGGAAAATTSPDAGAQSPPATAAPQAVARRFRANEAAERLLDTLSPPRASRALGVLDEARRKEVGLDQQPRRLELRTRREVHAFEAAVPPYGLGTAYLEAAKDRRVFLVQAAPLNDLDGAQLRLIERRLHRFELEQVEAVTVTLGDRKRELVRAASREPVPQLKLAPKERPEAPDETATTWHERLFRVLVTEVLAEGEQPPGGAPRTELRADYRAADGVTGFLEVARSGNDYFARSELTAGWVKLYAGAAEVIKEAPRVLGGK